MDPGLPWTKCEDICQTREDKILICEWCHWSMATSTVSLCWCWWPTFWTSPRPINFLCKFYVGILMLLWNIFQCLCKKALFSDSYAHMVKWDVLGAEFIFLLIWCKNYGNGHDLQQLVQNNFLWTTLPPYGPQCNCCCSVIMRRSVESLIFYCLSFMDCYLLFKGRVSAR